MSNNFEHCHVYTTDFLSSKVKFIHTSTVTRLHSCYEKSYAYASRTSCSFMKSVSPVATECYEIRNPSFHRPAIKTNLQSVPYSMV